MTLVAEAGIENDGFRDPHGPGAHEWWYFDATDPASGSAIVIIFFRGIPFSGRRQKHRDLPADRFPAVAFSLYGPERTEQYFVNLHDSVRIDPDRMGITVGNNRARYEGGAYRITIDDELLDGRPMRAEFRFEPEHAVASHRNPLSGGEPPHSWVLAAPRCHVSSSLPFSGTGYHDHNIGNRSLQDQFRHWRWGRAHFTDETFVFYEADGQSTFAHRVVDEQTARNLYGVRYARAFRVETDRGAYRVEQSRIVDNGPFYLRMLSRFTSPAGETVTGFSEVLRPRALNWRWFWPLLDSRVRPFRSGDRVGRKITQWLIQRGF